MYNSRIHEEQKENLKRYAQILPSRSLALSYLYQLLLVLCWSFVGPLLVLCWSCKFTCHRVAENWPPPRMEYTGGARAIKYRRGRRTHWRPIWTKVSAA